MMIPLAALYLLNLSFLPLKGDELLPFFAAANVGLIGLIVAAIGARFLFPSASREGRAVWIPLTSPVPARKMIAQKILFNLPPVMLLSLLLLIGASQIMRLSPGWAIWSLVYGFALSFLIGLLALFLGFCFPTYSYRHLMEISLGKGAFLFMIVALVQIISFEYITIRQLLIDPQSPLSPFNRDLFFWFAAWVFWVWFCYRAGKRRWAISPDRDQ